MWRQCLALCLAAAPAAAQPSLLSAPHTLLVESLPSPEGLDTPAPRFSWQLSPAAPGARALLQRAYELQLTFLNGSTFTTSQTPSNATSLVTPPGLPALPPSSRLTWRVRAWHDAAAEPSPFSLPAAFTTGVGDVGWGGPWVSGARGTENTFRAAFSLPPGGVALALAHVAGLGVHAVTLNGTPPPGGTPERKLDGGWSSYRRTVLYTTHDLTRGLLQGDNVLGVQLGNGWFNSRGWYAQPPYGWPSATNGGGFSFSAPPLLRVLLVLTLGNGTQLRLATSGSGSAWQWSAAEGATTFDSLYDGETRSGARAGALAGWDAPGFAPAPSDWAPVVAADSAATNPAAGAALSWQAFEPTVRLTSSPPLTSWEAAPGVTVYDCGSNGVGVVRWTFRGLPPGANVTMRHAEVLQHPPYGPADGTLYFDNLRNAHATDYYSADGSSGVEVFEPAFSWHGFRYAQVSGLPAAPALSDVQCIRQGNGVAAGGAAAFSLPLLGVLQALATNTLVGSFQGGPGSCGQRDERQFFTGDTQVTAQVSMHYFRLRPLLAAWLRTGLDDQNEDGSIGFYLPTPLADARDGSPQWSTGFLTVAWLLLRLEGDLATLRAARSAILRYAAFNEGMYNASVEKCGGLACYWPAWPSEWQELGPSPLPSCMNAMAYLRDVQMARDIFEALGEGAQAALLSARLAARLAEFHAAFFNASSARYGAGTQSEQAMALWLGAPPTPAAAAAALAALLAAIEAAGFKHQTGIVGTRYLHEVLRAHGRADLTLRMLLDTSYPSFGFMAVGPDNPEPSSTLWELWGAHTGAPIMSSRNHLMFASYASALLMLAVGVTPRGDGAAQGVLVSPAGLSAPLWRNASANSANSSSGATTEPLAFASGTMATPVGPIAVSWARALPLPPAPPALCGVQAEAAQPAMAHVNLTCPPGQVIDGLQFVSFGHPRGACSAPGSLARNASCDAPSAPALVAAACLGKPACSIAVDFRAFSDPCPGSPKWLAVNASGCRAAPSPPPPPPPVALPLGVLNVSLPVGVAGGVQVPALGAGGAAGAVVKEGGVVVWAGGAFVPGAAGVVGARAVAVGASGGEVVEVECSSGEYSFEVY